MKKTASYLILFLAFISKAAEGGVGKYLEVAFEIQGQMITGFLDYPEGLVYMSDDTVKLCLENEAFFTKYFHSKTKNRDSIRITNEIVPYIFQKGTQVIYTAYRNSARQTIAVKDIKKTRLVNVIEIIGGPEKGGSSVDTPIERADTLWTFLPATIIDSSAIEACQFYFIRHGEAIGGTELIEEIKEAQNKIQYNPSMDMKEVEARINKNLIELRKYRILMVSICED